MKTIVVMPAYNAAKTLQKTVSDIPPGLVDEIIVVDDGSKDATVEIARSLGLVVLVHTQNRGYGAAQKTGYREAISRGAECIALIHPDYQYDTAALPEMLKAVSSYKGIPICLGSRMSEPHAALRWGMPRYRYLANRFLTMAANRVFGLNLSEYHTGFRIYRADFLSSVGFERLSDDFIFDFQMLFKAVTQGMQIAEVPVRFRYTPESSSISFGRAVVYGIGVLRLLWKYRFNSKNKNRKQYP